MLVISRTEGESFMIGENILVTISKVSGRKVRVGIDAPRELNVVRTELLARDKKVARDTREQK